MVLYYCRMTFTFQILQLLNYEKNINMLNKCLENEPDSKQFYISTKNIEFFF